MRSAYSLAEMVLGDVDLLQQVKQAPETTLPKLSATAKANTPLGNDPVVYRIVVCVLSGAMILVALGIVVLANWVPFGEVETVDKLHLSGLIALGSGCVGTLAGFLSPTSFKR